MPLFYYTKSLRNDVDLLDQAVHNVFSVSVVARDIILCDHCSR